MGRWTAETDVAVTLLAYGPRPDSPEPKLVPGWPLRFDLSSRKPVEEEFDDIDYDTDFMSESFTSSTSELGDSSMLDIDDSDPVVDSTTSKLSTNSPGDVDLCLVCQRVFYSNKGVNFARRTHRAIDVLHGFKGGCGFCTLMWSALNIEQYRDFVVAASNQDHPEYHIRCSITDLSDRLLVKWPLEDSRQDFHASCEIIMITAENVPKLNMSTLSQNTRGRHSVKQGRMGEKTFSEPNQMAKKRRTVKRKQVKKQKSAEIQKLSVTSSSSSLALASAWLSHCSANHPLCQNSAQRERRLPTRLLRINRRNLVLCEGCDLSVDTPYATLSHCWGGYDTGQFTQVLSQANLRRSLSRCDLLPTFQHAVSVAESLDIRYLWIDSLCIIQDSALDRHSECARMWEVYGNSHCNISATASSNSSEGLFRNHDAGGALPCVITPQWQHLEAEVFEEGHGFGYHFFNGDEFPRNIDDSPLCRRGWVIQERFLSPRVLHFGSNQLWWECRELCASEQYPHGLPKEMDGTSKHQWDPSNLLLHRDSEICYRAWDWYVQQYSRCGLSRPEDKLVALAGMARQISDALQACDAADDYLAGLWGNRFPSALLWNYSYHCKTGRRSHAYRAPTWSWASVDGEVSYLEASTEGKICHAELLSAATTTKLDPFGAVSDGAIEICAPLIRLQLSLKARNDWDLRERAVARVRGHCVNPITLEIMGINLAHQFDLTLCFDDPHSIEVGKGFDVHALLLSGSQGLILQPVMLADERYGVLKGTFIRIATFTCDHGLDRGDLQALMQAGAAMNDPALLYNDYIGGGRYTVTII